MKPQKFYIGQEVTPRAKPRRVQRLGNPQMEIPYGVPQFGEIYKVTRYEVAIDGSLEWYIGLTGFKDAFSESFFCPIVEDQVVIEELNEVELEAVNLVTV